MGISMAQLLIWKKDIEPGESQLYFVCVELPGINASNIRSLSCFPGLAQPLL